MEFFFYIFSTLFLFTIDIGTIAFIATIIIIGITGIKGGYGSYRAHQLPSRFMAKEAIVSEMFHQGQEITVSHHHPG